MDKSKVGQVVWVACRAVQGCEGRYALIVSILDTRSSGRVVRYRCEKCKRSFQVNF